MESTRQQKVGRLIQKDLSQWFQQHGKEYFHGMLISVTVVRVTKDMSIARAYLSIFPSEKSEDTMARINELKGKIRGDIGRLIGKQVRIVPDFEFYIDDSFDYIDKIDSLLSED
ncbi:MAG: 30S ribosome-binding factor RbfA [Bacteroidales bacterium]